MSLTTAVPLVKNIVKDGPFAFIIQWTNGQSRRYALSTLQKHCPCARCVEDYGEPSQRDGQHVPNEQRAHRLKNVGRYALRIDFASGCSHGIFDFEQLYQMGDLV